MNTNETVINHFYTSFKNKDIKGMQDCYASNAVFNDPVFINLSAIQVRSMWEMLIKSGKDMRIDFTDVHADKQIGTASWQAFYTFSVTGNKVVNKVKASFIIDNGKIISHTDDFSFYQWAKQALGLPGLLLGWSPFLRNKIRKKAAENLRLYMAAK